MGFIKLKKSHREGKLYKSQKSTRSNSGSTNKKNPSLSSPRGGKVEHKDMVMRAGHGLKSIMMTREELERWKKNQK